QRPHPVWCTRLVREDLIGANPLFTILEHYCGVSWNEIPLDGERFSMTTLAGLDFEACTLTSNAPPYSARRDRPEPGDNIGVAMIDRASGGRMFYAPGIRSIE